MGGAPTAGEAVAESDVKVAERAREAGSGAVLVNGAVLASGAVSAAVPGRAAGPGCAAASAAGVGSGALPASGAVPGNGAGRQAEQQQDEQGRPGAREQQT